jgi:hypothetical protein
MLSNCSSTGPFNSCGRNSFPWRLEVGNANRIETAKTSAHQLLVTTLIAATAMVAAGCGRNSGTAATAQTASPSVVHATPPGRQGAAMAYDPQLREVVMFGGGTQTAALNDTWAWDGKGWSELHPATVPSSYQAVMAYDPATRQLLLVTSDQAGDATWAWNHGNWSKLLDVPAQSCTKTAGGALCSPAVAQGPAQISAMVYDAALGKAVVQSGFDSWAWDGRSWAKLASLDQASGAQASCFCLVYDSTDRELLTIVYSGGKFTPEINHTLSLSDGSWKLVSATAPAASQMLLADDPATSSVVVLLGNQALNGNSAPEAMWSWEGSSWHQVNVTLPAMLPGASVGYDGARKQLVLFGGIDAYGSAVSDTWLWNGRSWQKQG